LICQGIIQAIVAWSVETLGDQAHRSRRGIATREPANLACRKSEPISGPDGLQIAVDDGLDTLQSVEIAHRKCHSRVLPHLQSPDPEKGPRNYPFGSQKRTFELSQKRTSELGCYI
jgi:hypothetical protein